MIEVKQKKKESKKIERKFKGVERFTLSYDATDNEYAQHKINAHNLVKVVQDMITLIERSDRLLNGKQKTVEIFLQAPDSGAIVKEGSLQIPFAVELYEYVCTVKDVVTSIDTKDIFAALGLGVPTVSVGYGVFKDIFRTKGEPVIDVKTQDGSDEVELLTENTKITTSRDTAVLMQDPEIRRALKDLTVTPLANKANAVFKIKSDEIVDSTDGTKEEQVTVLIESGKEIDTLTKLSENIVQEPEVEIKSEAMVTITQINFSSGESGWKMKYDSKERAVVLRDIVFLSKINADQASFRKGDWLKVNLKIVKTLGVQTKTTYIITEVVEHLVGKDRKLTEND
ncbi:hypothetical protein [Haemophilus haemolyticus]|jgi:hypothetical protein|uniref:hypothetical protein n=1 Tax=Haemophilus haemolyticus TaxID=726 RepID=UPI000E590778|nr:hypothetical protein [Haemophilus haemolyticus]